MLVRGFLEKAGGNGTGLAGQRSGIFKFASNLALWTQIVLNRCVGSSLIKQGEILAVIRRILVCLSNWENLAGLF
jgi:hypothetical protein